MSTGSDIKISAVSKPHFTVVFTQFTSIFKRNDIHHLYIELLYQYTRVVFTQDTSEIRDILGVRSMKTTKKHHGYVRASLIMGNRKKKLKQSVQEYLQIGENNVTNYYISAFKGRYASHEGFLFCSCRNSPWLVRDSSLSRLHDHGQTYHIQWDSSWRVISPTQRERHPCRRRDSNPQSQPAIENKQRDEKFQAFCRLTPPNHRFGWLSFKNIKCTGVYEQHACFCLQ